MEDYKNKLYKIHEELKNHPFRIGFDVDDIPSYKNSLYELSEIWSNMCWKEYDKKTPEEQKRFRQFCCWIHNFRQELRTYRNRSFPMEFFSYYEQIIQITHNYLNDEDMSTFFKIAYFWPKGKERTTEIVQYKYYTEEDLGIKSKFLPAYLPVGYKFNVPTLEDAEKYFDENGKYTLCMKWKKDKEFFMKDWEENYLPIYTAINNISGNTKEYPVEKIINLEALYI